MFVAGKKRKLGSLGVSTSATASATTDTAGSAESSEASAVDRWYALGTENFRSKQYRNALDYYNRSVAAAKKDGIRDAKVYEARALTLYRLKEYSRAMDDAKDAIRINPHSAIAYSHMANVMAATGKPQEALEIVDRGLLTIDPQVPGYKHMQAMRESLMKKLDPSYVPQECTDSDPVARLPTDICVVAFSLLDTRSLVACRSVCRRWLALIDSNPVLWSRPCFSTSNPVSELAQQLPAYSKFGRMLRLLGDSDRVPDSALCTVLKFSREALKALVIPDAAEPSLRTLNVLFAYKRPLLENINIGRGAKLNAPVFGRVLSHCLAANVSAIHVPYSALVTDSHIATIARSVPQLRSLDISGCAGVRIRQLFRAWNATLTDSHRVTCLERLYLCDHPGIPEFLVYSCKHRHFSNLRVLHLAIRDQNVYARISSIAPLMRYFEQIDAVGVPFPSLCELNIDGIWDATTSVNRFESQHTSSLVLQSHLINVGLRRLSALNASAVGSIPLLASLQRCISTLEQFHLTRASGLSPDIMQVLAQDTAHMLLSEPLRLTSLDLSGCVGATAHSLSMVVRRCPGLVHVNLSQTAADNSVLSCLTEFVNLPDSKGLQVVILDTTDITGAAARDFAAACERRFRRLRREGYGALKSGWRLRLFDMDNCTGIGSDAVAVVRDLLSAMGTRVSATSADEDDGYEYETEEYYVVASLPYRALEKAAEVANNPNRPGARVDKYNKRVMEIKKMKRNGAQKEAGKGGGQEGNNENGDDDDGEEDDEDDEDSDYENSNDDGEDDDESKRRARAQRGGRRVAQYALIDVDTTRPMLELEGSIYLGKHDELLGTHLLFDIGADNEDGSERTRAELVGATSKTIVFDPVRLRKNKDYIL
ncbi:hypothetical protein LPJ53_005448 [Coemansia erecta]|uniref:F-box domain-containing protein n=1 Tax=Coemansia erecta TaxID=147472 RepID=A0A9W7XWQ2_9FUNG|nr:hypothetical protein LPJ53_005448 [Coemansia erecta]